jgi:hypothetical protein
VRAAAQTPVPDELRRTLSITRRALRFAPRRYRQTHWNQEQVAENVKRLRADYCFGTVRDTLNRLAPRPAGPRAAFIRVAEPIGVGARLPPGRETDDGLRSELLSVSRTRLQNSLDRLLGELPQDAPGRRYPNPFAEEIKRAG